MGSYALPALSIRPPQQQENPIQQYGQLLQLKNALQEAPLRQQALQQQVAAGQQQQQMGDIQLQQAQQQQQDQAAFRTAMQDPSFHGKTIGDVADHLAMTGQISQTAWTQAKKADLDQRQTLATLDKDQLANMKAAHASTQELYNSVMDLPDEQLAAQWPQIAQQYDAIPGNNKQPLDPAKPLTKQQLQQFGPLISMQRTYLDEATERQKKQAELAEAQSKAKLSAAQAEAGGTSDQAKTEAAWLKANNLPDTPENRLKAFDYYNKQTKIAPAEVRAQILMQTPTQVFDPATGQTTYTTRRDALGKVAPSSAEAQGEKGTVKYFTSGKGGQQITAFNTAVDHLSLLDKLASDLGNSNLQVFNKAAQSWAQQTGNPAPTNFEAAKNAMSGEVAAALKASGATDKEIEKVDQTFSKAQSPIQLKGAIGTYRMLLNSKRKNLEDQYKQGMKGQPNFTDSQQSDPFSQFGGKAH